MKLVIQRVSRASVEVENQIVSKIGRGLMLLLGIEQGDTEEQAKQLGTKVMKCRLWPDLKDSSKQWASSVVDNGYEVLVVSQFTLFATFKKPKPDFHQAMGGEQAQKLYMVFVDQCKKAATSPQHVSTGSFGAMMQVDLCNDGPVTVEMVAESPNAAGQTAPSSGTAAPVDAGKHGAKPVAKAKTIARESSSDACMENMGVADCSNDGAAKRADGQEVELDALLVSQPYVNGFHPSRRDAELFESFGNPGCPVPKSPHVVRWYEHIASFTPSQRSHWPMV